MEHLNKKILTLLISFSVGGLSACGVKGRPLPPLNPAPMGRGEPTYKETNQKKPVKKYTSQKEDDEKTSAEAEEP